MIQLARKTALLYHLCGTKHSGHLRRGSWFCCLWPCCAVLHGFGWEMEHIKSVISTYQRRLVEMPYVPTSYRRASLGGDGDANKLFLTYLHNDKDLGIQFLKDVGLLHSRVTCNTCGCVMIWCLVKRSRSRSGQNRWNFEGRYSCMNCTQHYGHQRLMSGVPGSRRARLHTPHRQSLQWLQII